MIVDIFAKFGNLLMSWFDTAQMQIAMLHTMFNVATTIILIPFIKPLVKLVTLIIPEKKGAKEEDDTPRLYFLNEQILTSPPLAVQSIKREILNMYNLAKGNLDIALDAITSTDISKKDELKVTENKDLKVLNDDSLNYLVLLIIPLATLKELATTQKIYLSMQCD